jgi:hypothetical protein
MNVKRIWCLMIVSVLLCGCSGQQVVETVTDEWLLSTVTAQKELALKLPATASKAAMAAEDGAQLYFCDGYVLTLQTVPSGDLDRTARALCGYEADKLTVLQTKTGGVKRYDWTWTSAGEGSVEIGRAAVLDDGDYHYCLTVMADESSCGSLNRQWDALFASLGLKL